MRTLSSLLHRRVETESGESLGRLFDLRGKLTQSRLEVTGLVVGRRGFVEHLGMRSSSGGRQRRTQMIPWAEIVRIEGDRIVVRDGTSV